MYYLLYDVEDDNKTFGTPNILEIYLVLPKGIIVDYHCYKERRFSNKTRIGMYLKNLTDESRLNYLII